jgi:CRP-like cAMP-binding protein
MTEGIVERLSQLALFADLRRPQIEAVAHMFDDEVFAPGHRVLRQGLTGSAFYIVLEGEAAIIVNGKEVARFGRGEFFGEISALTGDPPAADVRAEGLLRCLVIPGDELEQLLLEHPSVAVRMLRAEAYRLSASNRWH